MNWIGVVALLGLAFLAGFVLGVTYGQEGRWK